MSANQTANSPAMTGNLPNVSATVNVDEFLNQIAVRNPNEPEFLQAVHEVAQDVLPYTEPPFWYYPTRQSLGHALLKSGDYSGAEAVYRADLAQYPRNGWSLFGLSLSLEAQGKTEAAQKVKQRFDNIWGRADVELKSSVL